MKMLQRQALRWCPTKRHDAKRPLIPPDLCFFGARRCRGHSLQSFCSHFRRLAETGLLKSNLSLMWGRCPELPHRRCDIAENRLAAECRGEIESEPGSRFLFLCVFFTRT